MEIRQLEYFLMVSQVNSFTRAAERLYVSQPAVTNAIRGLEDELGIQLFDRNQKQALLTAEGRIFYRHVEQVMHGISNTLTEIHALKSLNGGVLNIGLTPLGGIYPSVTLLKEFYDNYPNIKIFLQENDTEALQKALLEDKLDVAVVFDGRENHSLTYMALPRQELVVCCARKHRFRRQNAVQLKDLVEEPLILFHSSCLFRKKIVRAFEQINTLPQIIFESAHVQTMKNLIATGMGLSILPESLCEADDLTTVALSPPLYIQPAIAYKTNRHPSHAAEAFLDVARKGVGKNERT